jgi:DNA-binding GntR family transcriptional regulator
MKRLTESILQETATLPEGTPITAKMWLHLGSRAALDQALSRLVRRGKLLRAGRGVYVAPVASRFGSRAPSVQKVVEELSLRRGETVVPSGASAANALGLTTQVPTRTVYLTSGRSRKITLDKQIVHLQHAPSWQLTLAKEPAGEIVRALAWAGPERVNRALKEIEAKVPRSEFRRISQQSSLLPLWMATALCQAVHYA